MDQVGWPKCGEIDIIEMVNNGTASHVTLHGPQGDTDYFGGVESGQVVGTSGPIADLSQDFHEYWVDWRPKHITIGVDGTTLGAFTPASLSAGRGRAHPMRRRPFRPPCSSIGSDTHRCDRRLPST